MHFTNCAKNQEITKIDVIFDDVGNSRSQMLQVAESIVARAGEASDHIILVELHRNNWLRIQKFSIRH